jgi:hypothetical protein
MATFLFWNISKNNLIGDIVTLCHENEVDVLVLAESEIKEIELLKALNTAQPAKFINPSNPSSYLSFFFKYPIKSIQNVTDDRRISIYQIYPPSSHVRILLVALHLPSKLYGIDDDQTYRAIRVIQTIQDAEVKMGHTNTLVIGDFNMNPFENGLVSADGFHAVMDQQTARQQSRVVDGQQKAFFYNPMWGRMGDMSVGPPGTYYYQGSYVSYFWNTFDQILLRPNLLDYFSDKQLHVISKIGDKNLLDENGRIDKSISDHLPIMITLQLEKEV